ncbi:MAG: chromosomal replication initiator protein DnaA [Alphaproteobacteria bacterium]|nr:chromosomal replication initiator protein DnaA [Alphaproteobacteria bacterium]
MAGLNAHDEVWTFVQERMRRQFGDATYASWVQPLKLTEVREDAAVLIAPTAFMRDRIKDRFKQALEEAFQTIQPTIVKVEIGHKEAVENESSKQQDKQPARTPAKPSPSYEMIETETAVFDRRFTFENFVTGKSNQLAFAAARRVAAEVEVQFNPLFLYGGVGLGKTHLMHAIAWEIKQKTPERSVMYCSAEQFMYKFISALRHRSTIDFKNLFRSVDVLMIDDVQFISGKDSTQEEFFHTFNELIDNSKQIIISADRSPTDLEGMEERIKSRLGWGLVADIHPTDYELRLGILQTKAEMVHHQHGFQISERVLEFLAHRITSNVRELEGALTRLCAFSTLVHRPIDMDMAEDVLRDLLRASSRRTTVDEIQRKVAEHFNLKMSDMHSARRTASIARPRQIAMYLCKILTQRSLPDIGKKFGGRDHTTVIHAVRRVEQLMNEDHNIREDVQLLRRALESS